jgi:RHS repeat-associated protein
LTERSQFPRKCATIRRGFDLVRDFGTFSFNLRLPGQYYDPETGLHYNYNRDYDPAAGRYVEPDPIALVGGTNLYAYASEDPISRSDQFGLCDGRWVKWGEIIPQMPLPSWQTLPSAVCKCFWMCVPCHGPWMYDPNIYKLPSTWGVT